MDIYEPGNSWLFIKLNQENKNISNREEI